MKDGEIIKQGDEEARDRDRDRVDRDEKFQDLSSRGQC